MKIKYIKYDGFNGFQVYGFVKDNTQKLDLWKVRVKRKLKLFSHKVDREVYLEKGDYVYLDEYAQYSNKIKKSKYNPILLILKANLFKMFSRPSGSKMKTNSRIIEGFLKGD